MKYAIYDESGAFVQASNNPSVTILPQNTIELTDEQFAQWPNYAASTDRKSVVQSIKVPSFTEIKLSLASAAKIAIDAAAAKFDSKYLTLGGQQGMIYAAKEKQARDYKAALYPYLPDPLLTSDPLFLLYGHVRAWRGTMRVSKPSATDTNAADSIIGQADALSVISIARESIRLNGKASIDAATTIEDIVAARDAAIVALDTL